MNNTIAKCNVITMFPDKEKSIDFDALVPEIENFTESDAEKLIAIEEKQSFSTDKMPMEIFNELLVYFLDNKDYRSAFWIVLQANTGLRYVDVAKFRRIDLLNERNTFRDSILETEQKTGKRRINFINDAIKMATLIYLWNCPEIKPLDLLISSACNPKAKNKGYEKETYVDENGKKHCLRVNGKFVYKLDADGNKIPKALTREQACSIMRNALIHGLGISIRNDKRTKNNNDAYLLLASHSLRKCYSDAVVNGFVEMFDKDIAYAHAAAMEQLQYDLNHSTRAMSYHYIKDYENTKRKINMNMNLGIEVLQEYFDREKDLYLNRV